MDRLGYLFRSRSFSWVWKRDGKDTASICVESGRDSVTLKYYFRSYGGERSDVSNIFLWIGSRAGSEGSALGFYAMAFRMGVVAIVGSGISMAPESCSRVAIVTGSLTRANRNRLGNGAC